MKGSASSLGSNRQEREENAKSHSLVIREHLASWHKVRSGAPATSMPWRLLRLGGLHFCQMDR